MNLNNKSLRLPKVRNNKRSVPTIWKLTGKAARVTQLVDGDRYRLSIQWSPKLTLIHKHVFTNAQLEKTIAKMTQKRVIDTRYWDKRYPAVGKHVRVC